MVATTSCRIKTFSIRSRKMVNGVGWHHGTRDPIPDRLRRTVRTAEKPYPPRTSASVDRPSGDTTSGGEPRGRDPAQNIEGRKRPIVVDRMGLLRALLVTAADVDDAQAAAEWFTRRDGPPRSTVARRYADSKDHNRKLYEWVEGNAGWERTLVRRPKDSEGWVKLPIRWTVERTFAGLGRCRRLSKDREKSVLSSESFVKWALIRLMLNSLDRNGLIGFHGGSPLTFSPRRPLRSPRRRCPGVPRPRDRLAPRRPSPDVSMTPT